MFLSANIGFLLYPVLYLMLGVAATVLFYAVRRREMLRITPNIALPAVLRTMPGALFVTDPQGIILFVNTVAARMTGVSEKELVGRTLSTFVPFISEVFTRVAGTPKDRFLVVSEEETALKTVYDAEIAVTLSASVIRDQRDNIIAISVVCSDISSLVRRTTELAAALGNVRQQNEQLETAKRAILNVLEDVDAEKNESQRLAADLKKFQLAVENTSEHIGFMDQSMKVLYVNKAAEKNTGFSKEEIIGKSPVWWEQQAHNGLPGSLRATLGAGQAPFAGEMWNRRKSGERYLGEVRISPVTVRKGDVPFLVYVERDITEQKKLEEARSNFISTASHQLRTPMTSMRWFTEMLIEGDAGKLNKEQKHYAVRIQEGVERVVHLINLLLQTARVEAGRVKIEPTPLDQHDFVKEVVSAVSSRAAQRKINITVNVPSKLPKISLDHDVFWQVLENLLTNAVMYSNEGGTVTVSVVHEKDKKAFLYSVRDGGIGIPVAQQGRIFEKFFRADNAIKQAPEGSGLGLSLAKHLVEGWGGSIWFESAEGKGTTFYFTVSEAGMSARDGEVKLTV